MDGLSEGSVDLVVTSPPYPMIGMWDRTFCSLNPEIAEALERREPLAAFERMHRELDRVWKECFRVLKPAAFACINIGDATRTVDGDFQLFSNHARILAAMSRLGFTPLPDILWRKQTNAPNKFLGSGMLPAGAYVTYEHEYILIFRKGAKREFLSAGAKLQRRLSAYFWEERNLWFSDVWMDLKGAVQKLRDPDARSRSGAYPFELPHRIIQMYSVLGDTVLDPFLGTGTTALAAAASGRNSAGFEIDASLAETARAAIRHSVKLGSERAESRLTSHEKFVAEQEAAGRQWKHRNRHYGFPVMTRQEVDLVLYQPRRIQETEAGDFEVVHTSKRRPRVQFQQAEFDFPELNPPR